MKIDGQLYTWVRLRKDVESKKITRNGMYTRGDESVSTEEKTILIH